jgi:hypothetical protein
VPLEVCGLRKKQQLHVENACSHCAGAWMQNEPKEACEPRMQENYG